MKIQAGDIIRRLNLKPLPEEGGYYSETYRSKHRLAADSLAAGFEGSHSLATTIFYLITSESFSRMHRLPSDEVWHFYLGDPAEQLLLFPDGTGKVVTLGNDITKGELLQSVVPALAWQGTILKPGGSFALFGTTVTPGFEFADYQPGSRDQLRENYQDFEAEIIKRI